MKKYFGKSRSETLWLLNAWLKDGPPVCFLDGFPGVGKTDLALELMDAAEKRGEWEHLAINNLSEASASVEESLMELSSRLSTQGLPEMESVLWQQAKPVLGHAFERALQRSVLIIIDEAQRLFLPDTGSPRPEVTNIFSYLRHRPTLKGRLLLLSDRFVQQDQQAPWSEWIPRHTLRELKPEEGVKMLDSRLEEAGASSENSLERKMRALKTLHYNPRAIEALVARLQSNSLDQVMADNPGFWATEDPQIDPRFLQNLERSLLKETMSELDELHQRKLWRLSVYRHTFHTEALDKLGGTRAEIAQLHDLLTSRFFLNFHKGNFTLNPIVREISLSHLKDDSVSCKQAHAAAAEYYARPFTARQMVGSYGKLAESFAELRYHLVQAGRKEELSTISQNLTDYLKQGIKAETPVPLDREELDYRIGVLTSLLEEAGAKGLEYHLARCLRTRNAPGDMVEAIKHAHSATGSRKQEAPWVLLAHLKREVDGNAAAMEVIRRAIRTLSDGRIAGPLYRFGAELLVDDKRSDEALAILKEGIKNVPPEKNLFSLYQFGAELLCRMRKPSEALALLREGIGQIPQPFGRQTLEVATLLLRAAIGGSAASDMQRDVGERSNYNYVAALSRVLQCEDRDDWVTAARVARDARLKFPWEIALATHEALARLAVEDNKGALHALTSYPNLTLDKGTVTSWLEALIHLRRNRLDDAERSLQVYLDRPVSRDLEVNESFLLRLWDEQEVCDRGNGLCFHLPILPSSLTGFKGPVRRLQFADPVLYAHGVLAKVEGLAAPQERKPDIYVSYAWGEDTTQEGRRREEMVDELCKAVGASGWEIGRDKERMRSGDSIDLFTKEVARANRIVAVISEKFLHSEYCMARELFRVYKRCDYERGDFQEKVIAIVMDDAKPILRRPLLLVNEWKAKANAEREELIALDAERVNRHLWGLMDLKREMVTHLAGMLDALTDIVMPQGFNSITANDFKDVIDRL